MVGKGIARVAGLLARTDSGIVGDGVTRATRPTVIGTADPGAIVSVYLGEIAVGTTKAGTDGTWSFTMRQSLSNGTHLITARIAGQEATGTSPEPFALTVDTLAPLVSQPILAVETDTGLAGDGVTSQTSPALTGTAEAGATVTVLIDGIAVADVVADDTGAWEYQTASLADGLYRIGVRATDLAGNVSATRSMTLKIDTTIATPEVLGLAARSDTGVQGDDLTRLSRPSLSGTAEAGATVTVFIDGVAAGTVNAGKSGQWTFGSATLEDGTHEAYAVATDAAGNASPPSEAYQFTVDTEAPESSAAILSDESDTGIAGDGITGEQPVLTGVAEAGAMVSVWIDGIVDATVAADAETGVWTHASNALGEGRHSVSIRATDAAGNNSATRKSYIVVDTIGLAPTITGLAAKSDTGTVSDGITRMSRPTVTGTAEAGAVVTLYDGETEVGTATVGANGIWAVTPASALSDGAHVLTARIVDRAGNGRPL